MNNIIKDTVNWLSVAKQIPTSKEALIKELQLVKKLMNEELDEMIQGVEDDNRSEQLNGFVDAGWVLSNAYYFLQITDEEFQNECDLVNRSNNTKYCKTLDEALETKRMYLEGTHPNKLGQSISTIVITTNSVAFPYAVMNNSGKLLKSINFKDINQLDK